MIQVSIPLHQYHWCNSCRYRDFDHLEDPSASKDGQHACAHPDSGRIAAFRADSDIAAGKRGYVYTCNRYEGKRWSTPVPVVRKRKGGSV